MQTQEQEIDRFKQLMEFINSRTLREEKAVALKDFLDFYANSNYLVHLENLRKNTKLKLEELSKEPLFYIYKPEFIKTCKRISEIEGEPLPIPGCMDTSVIPVINSQYIKAGTFGCAIKPALPNRINTDEWVYFPENITKVFYKEEDAEKAYKISDTLYKKFRNSGHKAYKYEYKNFKGSNLPENTRKKCRVHTNEPLYPLRMPNLGYDMEKPEKHKEDYINLPVDKILEQILKLMTQVYQIYQSDHIHGDIRETNVMIHPVTGSMTLIDFDWYFPTDLFFDNYHEYLGFYNNPPEAILGKYITRIKDSRDIDVTIRSILNKRALNVVNTYIKFHQFKYQNTPLINDHITYDRIEEILNQSYIYFITNFSRNVVTLPQMYHAYCNMMRPSFDSFGLAFTLLNFLYSVYKPVFEMKGYLELQSVLSKKNVSYSRGEIVFIYDMLTECIQTILKPMSSYEIWNRMPISVAVEKMNAFYNRFTSGMASISAENARTPEMRGGRRKTRRQTRKS
jgi:thiamine kinase-like enzyme